MSKPRSLRDLDAIDQGLLNEMQDRFPVVPNPFQELGARVGVAEVEAVTRVRSLREFGVLRQLSPIYDTKALGYSSSLVAMRVAPERLADAAAVVNAHPGVSHNYKRDHEFNLWLTVAVPPGVDVRAHVDALHHLAGAESTRMLPTPRLFKIGVTLDMTGERPIDDRSQPQYTHQMREEAANEVLSSRDVDIVRAVQGDLEVVPQPLAGPARALNMSVAELIEALESLQRRGFLRRVAAILRHRRAGFGANGMAVWAVPQADVLRIGEEMAGYTAISHCYQRPTYEDWPYNVFTMIHARKKDDCHALVEQLSNKYRLTDYDVLYSTHEYKKVRLSYFTPDWDEWEEKNLYSGRRAHAV